MFMIGDFYIRMFLVNDRRHFEACQQHVVVAGSLADSVAAHTCCGSLFRFHGWARRAATHGIPADDEI